jgi:hypothetical protein
VGGGGYYLTSASGFRNQGSSSYAPAGVATKTTRPPILFSNAYVAIATNLPPQAIRDTNAAPDLGYHYDPLDYVFGGCEASSLTFSAGTAVGWFRTTSGWEHAGQGIHIDDRQTVTFAGTASTPDYWVRLNTVQEQDLSAGYGPGGMTSWADQNGPYTNAAQVFGYFLHCTTMNYGDLAFRDDWGILTGHFTDCEFDSTGPNGYVSSYYLTNCLFDRGMTGLWQGEPGVAFYIGNCTFHGGYIYLTPDLTNIPVTVLNSSFDGTSLDIGGYGSNTSCAHYDYNAFTNTAGRFPIGGVHDVIVTNGFHWQSSWLGNYYLPTNSPVIDKGGTTADQLGLYHFTTQTNQVPEADSVVDIGYHYVATDASGNPLDSNGDGMPDYLEDANGNGLADNGETPWISTIGYFFTDNDAVEPFPGESGEFYYMLDSSEPPVGSAVFAYQITGGTAVFGTDYTLNLLNAEDSSYLPLTSASGIITNDGNLFDASEGYSVAAIEIVPLVGNATSNLTVTMTISTVPGGGCLVDSSPASTTLTIIYNPFHPVMEDINSGAGVDYYAPSNSLIVSANSFNSFDDVFAQVHTNTAGALLETNWTTLHDLTQGDLDEINFSTVKVTANGFTNGEVYYTGELDDTGTNSYIGKISADGRSWQTSWATLTNENDYVGGTYVDQTGVFGGDLIAVTDRGGVWRVKSSGQATLLANVGRSVFLEGVLTLPNDVTKYGPWAGKIITGDSDDGLIWVIDTNGVVTNYNFGFPPESFAVIPTNQPLYCLSGSENNINALLKVSSDNFTNNIGDIVIPTEEWEGDGDSDFYIVHWNGTNFVNTAFTNPGPYVNFEQCSFAPINLPVLTQ